MEKFERKTFGNSYLFNLDKTNFDKINRKLAEYIIKAERIDKTSEAFAGIIEETKRFQSTSVLYSILMNNKIVLCINETGELPASFKVYEAKDIRFKDGTKVFIDCTGLIKLTNGYFTCKKIDVFFTYLYEALNILLYSEQPQKYMTNSAISISAAECYVSLFNYVIDYLRIIGYAQSKAKISYLTSLFFLHNMMGKDIDTYTKNLAGKIAKLSNIETRGFELYYKEEDFNTIDTFITMIADTFKLKGFNTEVFIGQWIYSFGKGTEYACELYTSFANMMIGAYCGAYVVHQKTIEKCCGAAMVSMVTAINKLASEEFDRRGFLIGEAYNNATQVISSETKALQEKLNMRNKKPDDIKFTDFSDKAKVKKTTENLLSYYRSSQQENKIGDELIKAGKSALSALKKSEKNDECYAKGVLPYITKTYSKYKSKSNLDRSFRNDISHEIEVYTDKAEKAKKKNDKELIKRLGTIKKELIDTKNSL